MRVRPHFALVELLAALMDSTMSCSAQLEGQVLEYIQEAQLIATAFLIFRGISYCSCGSLDDLQDVLVQLESFTGTNI